MSLHTLLTGFTPTALKDVAALPQTLRDVPTLMRGDQLNVHFPHGVVIADQEGDALAALYFAGPSTPAEGEDVTPLTSPTELVTALAQSAQTTLEQAPRPLVAAPRPTAVSVEVSEAPAAVQGADTPVETPSPVETHSEPSDASSQEDAPVEDAKPPVDAETTALDAAAIATMAEESPAVEDDDLPTETVTEDEEITVDSENQEPAAEPADSEDQEPAAEEVTEEPAAEPADSEEPATEPADSEEDEKGESIPNALLSLFDTPDDVKNKAQTKSDPFGFLRRR